MSSPPDKSDHRQRLVELSNPLVREAITTLSRGPTDFHAHLILFDLCLRMYYTGLVDGANQAAAHVAAPGAEADFSLGVTVPSGPLGSAS